MLITSKQPTPLFATHIRIVTPMEPLLDGEQAGSEPRESRQPNNVSHSLSTNQNQAIETQQLNGLNQARDSLTAYPPDK